MSDTPALPDADDWTPPAGWVDPRDDDALPWLQWPTDADLAELEDLVPPAERLAEEPEHVEVADRGQRAAALPMPAAPLPGDGPLPRGLIASGLAGIDLTDYSRGPAGRGFGSACKQSMAVIQLTEARISVHVAIAELAGLIMRANEAQGYRYRKADTGAYNCRVIAGTSSYSWHAWAVAIDANWQSNPQRRPVTTDRPRWELDRWNFFGFAWGGDYTGGTVPDAMHTEYMGTTGQVPALLALAHQLLDPIIGGGVPAPAPAPAPAPSPAPASPWHDVPWGAVTDLYGQGEQVRKDQMDLIDSGFPVGAGGADGFAGPDTVAAIKLAQAALRVGVDGAMGQITRDALHGVPSYGLPAGHVWGPITGPATEHGGITAAEQAQVRRLQGQLIIRGVAGIATHDPGRTNWDDGKYEGATTAAVRRFQQADGLAVNGLVGPMTWTRLFR